jgi:hypothetical protein
MSDELGTHPAHQWIEDMIYAHGEKPSPDTAPPVTRKELAAEIKSATITYRNLGSSEKLHGLVAFIASRIIAHFKGRTLGE